jgi:integrase
MRSEDQDLSNKTHNGVLTVFHSGIQKLRHLDTSLFRNGNPVKVKKLQENSYTHAAYSTDQLALIAQAIGGKDKQFLLFIRFIYYTLARPKEIRLIKVGHIRMDIERILMAGENAKENKESYVGISMAFKQIIVDSGILDFPANYYVFSRSGKPGIKATSVNYFSKRYRPYLKDLGLKKLNSRYSLYSFKHSGAIQLYLESKDINLIKEQCRHSTLSQTNTYLQELGLFTNFTGLKNWKGM